MKRSSHRSSFAAKNPACSRWSPTSHHYIHYSSWWTFVDVMVTKSLFFCSTKSDRWTWKFMPQWFRFQHYLFACLRLFRSLGGQSHISTSHIEIMDLVGRKNERIIKFRDLFKKHLDLMGWKSLITANRGRDSSKTHFILKVILKLEPRFVVSIKLEWNHLNKNLIPHSCPDQPFWYFPPLIYCHCIKKCSQVIFQKSRKQNGKKLLSLWALLWFAYYHFFWVTITVKGQRVPTSSLSLFSFCLYSTRRAAVSCHRHIPLLFQQKAK